MVRFKLNRRRFLLLTGISLAAGSAAYTYTRGLRLPLLHFTGNGPVTARVTDGVEVAAQGAVFQGMEHEVFRFRAFVPEPRFTVRGGRPAGADIHVENVHPGAELLPDDPARPSDSLSEERFNLTRSVAVKTSTDKEAGFSWRFPKTEQYRFAAIGDSGGGTELQWVLGRAAELGADFLLHLGDIYYEEGDLDRASVHLNEASIPTYAAIGNHDFHLDWHAMYPKFNRLVGPSNSIFALGGVEFMNMDTAARFIPIARGKRAQIIQGLQPISTANGIRDRVAFTHMPLRDPDTERDRAVDRPAEARWVRAKLLASGTRNLLAGQIHIKEEFDDQGLHTYISGQGLAHADLIVERPYAEILLGDVEPGEPVRYQWQPLNMPFAAHCNRRNLGVLDALKRPDVKSKLLAQCGKA